MITLRIFNMKHFLDTVNQCQGDVYLLHPQGCRQNIARRPGLQQWLMDQHTKNHGYLTCSFVIPNTRDYLDILSYYVGDC